MSVIDFHKPPKDRDLTKVLAANLRQEMARLEDATGREVTYTIFAVYVGVAAETIRKILNGSLDPQLSTLGVIAKRLNRDASELLDPNYTASSTTPPYPGGRAAAPPGRHLVAVPDPASSGVFSSVPPAKVVGPRSVASQPISQRLSGRRVTSKVSGSRNDARDPSPAGRR